MFDGAAEQLHQFIAAAAASLTSPPHPHPHPHPPPFDQHHHHHHHHHHPYNNLINPSSNSHHLLLQPHHHELNQQQVVNIPRNNNLDQEKEESRSSSGLVSVIINDGDHHHHHHQADWGNDELLALLRIRSTMENWFPEFTWEHVSRKLAELGFKRSAEKCKEKFELETSYFNDDNNNNFAKNNNLRFLSADLENLYQDPPPPPPPPVPHEANTPKKSDEKLPEKSDEVVIEDSSTRNDEKAQDQEDARKKSVKKRKRRRRREKRLEMLKGYCTDVVKRMMEQQEEMHEKLLEDMARRNDDKLAREEAWKIRETERMNKELETMASEQAAAGERQSEIIKFLKKLSSSSENPSVDQREVDHHPTSSTTVQNTPHQHHHHQHHPQSPSSSTPINPRDESPKNPNTSDLGKRWPREEVLALINLRSGLFGNGNGSSENSGQDKDGAVIKAPLWERISQGMLEKGYERSAKRCKEKWENINKYFRKTKDVNKKRSIDSRTCPYFHQLSSLYNRGVLLVPSSDQDQPLDGQSCPTAEPEPENRGSGDSEENGMVVQEGGVSNS